MLGLYAVTFAFGAYTGYAMAVANAATGVEAINFLFGGLILAAILLASGVPAVIAAAWPGGRGRPAARRLLVGDITLAVGAVIGWVTASGLGSA